MSTKTEQKVAHDEKSLYFKLIFFFLERCILILENDEIPRGPRDQGKPRHFSERCYIEIRSHFQFVLTAYLCSETSLISVDEKFDPKYSPLFRNRNSGEAVTCCVICLSILILT